MNHSKPQLDSPEALPPLAPRPSVRSLFTDLLWTLPVLWTLLIGLALWRNTALVNHSVRSLAKVAAQSSFEKDLLYRQWATLHGGVYVPVTDRSPPNPYLTNINERDITTPSGIPLTLINPAYMTRQVHELGKDLYRHQGHITSLKPIRPENAPDDWERKALEAFARGVPEVSSIESIEGKSYLRLMRPMQTAAGCLKCHAAQGYQEGDIRGGISVSVPVQEYENIMRPQQQEEFLAHVGIWIVGLVAYGAGARLMHRRRRERDAALEALRESETRFRAIGSNTPDHIIMQDRELRYGLVINPQLGLTEAVMIGKTDRDFLKHEDAEKLTTIKREVIETGKPVRLETSLQNPKGEIEYFEGSYIPKFDATGQVDGLLGYFRNVTERKHLEAVQAFLAQRSSGTPDEPFFTSLARYLTQSLGMDFASIDRLEGGGLTARTVAVYCDGNLEDNVTCALKDTPCSDVVGQTVFCVPADVRRLFPLDPILQKLRAESYVCVMLGNYAGLPIGRIVVIGRRPLVNRWQVEATLKLVAVRVLGELERLDAEAARRVSEQRFRQIVESSQAGYFRIDRMGNFVEVNSAWLKMHGYASPEAVVGQHFTLTQVDADLPAARDIVEQLLAGQSMPEGEFTRRNQDGSIGYHTFSAHPILEGDRVVGLEGFLIDTTSLKRVRADFEMVFARMIDGFALHEIICDANRKPVDYRFLNVNPAFEKLTGLNAERAIGRTLREILPGAESFWVETYGRVALTGEPAFFEHLSPELDRYFEISAFCPAPGQFACVFVDITKRKRLEEQLRQAQKMEAIGQLAGGIAHDFNNILAATMMNLDLMQVNPNLDQEMRAGLKELEADAKRAASLTRQLLMFSRRSVLELQVLDLNQVVADLLKMVGRLLGEHLTLTFERGSTLPAVEADAGMLEQVLMNLTVNARDAMPKGGRITLTTHAVNADLEWAKSNPNRRAGLFVCLSVSDTGCGMDKATLDRIFEPFFTTKGEGKGTGLGLATVHGIVAQHQGWVEVESRVGQGTTFRIYLPASAKVQTETKGDGQLAVPTGQETLLVVEDNASVRQMLVQTLRVLGYRVIEAANGQEAMTRWREYGLQIDLLLTDMVMPEGMTGLELAEHVLAEKPNLKIIISSGYSGELNEPGRTAAAGIVYLPKPYQVPLLGKIVRECLDRKRGRL
jgi:PAS domain S-box-containing protein